MLGMCAGVVLAVAESRKGLSSNVEVDRGRAVAAVLGPRTGVVFASGSLTDTLATSISIPVLWSDYLYAFSQEGHDDRKKRLYKYLYYSGVDDIRLRAVLTYYGVGKEIFGADRVNPYLTVTSQPITAEEVARAVQEFKNYYAAFSRNDANTPALSYAIVLPTDDLSNLDRWYERDAGKTIEGYIIYQLKLRS